MVEQSLLAWIMLIVFCSCHSPRWMSSMIFLVLGHRCYFCTKHIFPFSIVFTWKRQKTGGLQSTCTRKRSKTEIFAQRVDLFENDDSLFAWSCGECRVFRMLWRKWYQKKSLESGETFSIVSPRTERQITLWKPTNVDEDLPHEIKAFKNNYSSLNARSLLKIEEKCPKTELSLPVIITPAVVARRFSYFFSTRLPNRCGFLVIVKKIALIVWSKTMSVLSELSMARPRLFVNAVGKRFVYKEDKRISESCFAACKVLSFYSIVSGIKKTIPNYICRYFFKPDTVHQFRSIFTELQ